MSVVSVVVVGERVISSSSSSSSSGSSRSMSVVVGECDGVGVGGDGSSLRPRIGDYFAPLFDVLFG